MKTILIVIVIAKEIILDYANSNNNSKSNSTAPLVQRKARPTLRHSNFSAMNAPTGAPRQGPTLANGGRGSTSPVLPRLCKHMQRYVHIYSDHATSISCSSPIAYFSICLFFVFALFPPGCATFCYSNLNIALGVEEDHPSMPRAGVTPSFQLVLSHMKHALEWPSQITRSAFRV